MCASDISPVVFRRNPRNGQLEPDGRTRHVCRDFERVYDWAAQHTDVAGMETGDWKGERKSSEKEEESGENEKIPSFLEAGLQGLDTRPHPCPHKTFCEDRSSRDGNGLGD